MCARKTTVEAVPLGLRQSTVDITLSGAEQVRTLEANSGVSLGPIVRQHLAVHQARQLPGSTLFALTIDNTARQAMSLDSQRATAEKTPTNEDRLARIIKIQIDGSWIEVMVDVSSLRQALGLPLHDLFDCGIYHRCIHS